MNMDVYKHTKAKFKVYKLKWNKRNFFAFVFEIFRVTLLRFISCTGVFGFAQAFREKIHSAISMAFANKYDRTIGPGTGGSFKTSMYRTGTFFHVYRHIYPRKYP